MERKSLGEMRKVLWSWVWNIFCSMRIVWSFSKNKVIISGNVNCSFKTEYAFIQRHRTNPWRSYTLIVRCFWKWFDCKRLMHYSLFIARIRIHRRSWFWIYTGTRFHFGNHGRNQQGKWFHWKTGCVGIWRKCGNKGIGEKINWKCLCDVEWKIEEK